MTRNRFLAAFSLALIGFGQVAHADIFYGATGAGGSNSSLYTIDPSTGISTLIGGITVGGNPISLTGIAAFNGTIYGATNSMSSFDPNSLVVINPANGAAMLKGSFGTSPNVSVQSIAFDSSGTLYGYSKSPTPEGVVTINTTTGAASPLGSSGSHLGFTSSGDGLAVSPTGTIYLAPGGATGPNATLDTITTSGPTQGQAVVGPAFSNVPLANSQIKAMAFDSLSDLYGIDFQPNSPFAADLVTINPSTGAITSFNVTQNGLVGLAIVPEPGSLLLTGLIAAGSALGIWLRRRFGAACPSAFLGPNGN